MTQPKTPAAKTIPPGCTHDHPAHERRMQLFAIRGHVRDLIRTRPQGRGDIEEILAGFATSLVRGDFVPTIAEGYQAILDVVNSRPDAEQIPLPLPPSLSVLPSASPGQELLLKIQICLGESHPGQTVRIRLAP